MGLDCEFMQFTGLLDKNGKEIFEGNILKYFEENFNDKNNPDIQFFEIDFYKGGFYAKSLEDNEYNEDIAFAEQCEVIGNVYENPELIKYHE
jgi:uncharacterized phage protein (TIGR01671 family)